MDIILENARAISELGLMAVISGLFIYLFYLQYQQTLKNQKLIMEHIMSIDKKETEITESKEGHQENLAIRMKVSNSINSKLYNIRNKLNAKRILLLEFHNSNENLSGLPFAKFSATYEQSRKGVIQLANRVNNYPFSMLVGIISEFDSNGIFQMDNLELLNDEYSLLYNLLKTNKIEHFYAIGLYDLHGKLFGLLGIQYDEQSHLEEFAPNYLSSLGYTFGSILDLKNPVW